MAPAPSTLSLDRETFHQQQQQQHSARRPNHPRRSKTISAVTFNKVPNGNSAQIHRKLSASGTRLSLSHTHSLSLSLSLSLGLDLSNCGNLNCRVKHSPRLVRVGQCKCRKQKCSYVSNVNNFNSACQHTECNRLKCAHGCFRNR